MPIDLCVVVPFYNEQDNVLPLLHEIVAVLSPLYQHEIVAVDDGSCDATDAALLNAAKQIPHLRIVNLPNNLGQSAAIANGVVAAKAPLIATLDGDGQNPPADIPALVQAFRDSNTAKPRLAIGWRTNRKDSWLKKLSSRIANRLRASLLRDNCPDTGCGLRVFARDTYLLLPQFNHMHRFMPALYRRMDGNIVVVPVGHRPRTRGNSKYGVNNRLWVGLIDLIGVAWLISRPCRINGKIPHE